MTLIAPSATADTVPLPSIDRAPEMTSFFDVPPGLDTDTFRAVVAHFGSGVTVVTARDGGEDFGTTASAFTSLSLNPPMVVVCLYRGAKTERAVARSGRFGINILRDSQGAIAERFASRREDRFAELGVQYGEVGVPLLDGVLAHFECRLAEQVNGGTHSIFIGRVVAATAHPGRPLAYYRGAFGQFLVGPDTGVLATLRGEIVNGELAPGVEIDVTRTAERLAAETGVVLGALRLLVADGYVARRPDGVYSVRAPDMREVLDMISACRTIEIGVAETTVGWVETADLDRLDELAAVPCACLPGADDEHDGPDFHEHMITFSGNRRLLEHYRELSPAGIRRRRDGDTLSELATGAYLEDHLALVAGFRTANLRQVVTAIDRHARRLRTAWARVEV